MNPRINNYVGFSKIDKVINKTAKQYHLESAYYKYKTTKYWHRVAGAFIDDVKELTQVMDFKNGVLKVACLSREVAIKINLLSKRIIFALNQALGKTVVFAIYIEV